MRNEADLIGGLFLACAGVLAMFGLFGAIFGIKPDRFWGGIFRGWKMRAEHPKEYQLQRFSAFAAIGIAVIIAMFGQRIIAGG